MNEIITGVCSAVERGAEVVVKGASKILRFLGRIYLPSVPNPNDPKSFFVTRFGLLVYEDFTRNIVAAARCASASLDVGVANIRRYALEAEADDAAIWAALPAGYVFEDAYEFCVHLAQLISWQPRRKDGNLLNNGFENVFYVHGVGGRVFAVCVAWSVLIEGWSVNAAPPNKETRKVGRSVFTSVD